ncbi:MAG: ribosome-binding factor A [Candidatus Berkelbacteria bacterium]|nr:ribosome-binding factor A [Candidatus Berkelbacteria bacterium]
MSQRLEKVNELIKQELSIAFVFDFPGEIITINFIHTAPDLSNSKIYVSVTSGHQSIYDGIKKKTGEYRKMLADKLFIRKIPKLEIVKDEMQSEIEHIEELIEKNSVDL